MRLKEAQNINKSIAALGNCIASLVQSQERQGYGNNGGGIGSSASMSHIPFRDSKLTRLLSESLSGNCKTTVCACINPSLMHYEETYSTLLFATRVMSVYTNALINEKIEQISTTQRTNQMEMKYQQKLLQQQRYAAALGENMSPRLGAASEQGEINQSPFYNRGSSEVVLRKQYSQLEEEAKELRNEVRVLKDQISRNDMSRQQSETNSVVHNPGAANNPYQGGHPYIQNPVDMVSQHSNERGSGWLAHNSQANMSPYSRVNTGVSNTSPFRRQLTAGNSDIGSFKNL